MDGQGFWPDRGGRLRRWTTAIWPTCVGWRCDISKSTKTKSSSKPWKPAQPYLLGAAQTIQDTVSGNQGNLNELAGNVREFLPGLGERAFGPNPTLGAANDYTTNVLGGRFLNANPYLDDIVGRTSDDVSDRVNSLFARSGGSLGTPHAGILARELANSENQLRYGNYAQERQNQQGAAGLVPGLNASQYAGVMPYLAATQTGAGLPYTGLGSLGVLGGLFNGYGTQTQTQGGGVGAGLLGAVTSLGSAALSNPAIFSSSADLKSDIKVLGPWDERGDGLQKVSFRYKWEPEWVRHTGVIAEQVKELRPWAYVHDFYMGKPGVNYARLSEGHNVSG